MGVAKGSREWSRELESQMGVAKWGRERGSREKESRTWVANGSRGIGSQMGVAKVGRENKKIRGRM